MAWILTIWAFALTVTIGSTRSSGSQDIPPDHARIYGILISRSSPKDETTLCQQNPCWALVKIANIVGYGSGFNRTLNIGDTIEVRFATTLLPTESLFPNRENPLPGLTSGEAFLADVKQKLSNDLLGGNSTYEINEYDKMN